MFSVKEVAASPPSLVAVTVSRYVSLGPEGVPEMTPVEGFKPRPEGSEGWTPYEIPL